MGAGREKPVASKFPRLLDGLHPFPSFLYCSEIPVEVEPDRIPNTTKEKWLMQLQQEVPVYGHTPTKHPLAWSIHKWNISNRW